MKIKYFGYNSFLIESGGKKIVIDPGALFLYFFRLTPLIPKSEWQNVSHIFVTHGDPDHYWHLDRIANTSGAKVICNRSMIKTVGADTLILGPRSKGVAFTTRIENLHPISVGETIEVDDIVVTGLKATHGPLTLKFGPFSKTVTTGPEERIGWGSMGFDLQFDGRTIVNLGDTLNLLDDWKTIQNPDVLMIPIGGKVAHNTMDEAEALQVVEEMNPKLVIPCHYNCPGLFSKKLNPADDILFKDRVQKAGIECAIMQAGNSIDI